MWNLQRTFRMELDASEAPHGSAARIGLPIPQAADEKSLSIVMDGAGVVWRAEVGAVADGAVGGVDFGAARVADGRVWLELSEARKLSLTLM